MRTESEAQPITDLLDDALSGLKTISASVGLLADLYGELGIHSGDADAARLGRMLDMIRSQAETAERVIENAFVQANVISRAAPPLTKEAEHPHQID